MNPLTMENSRTILLGLSITATRLSNSWNFFVIQVKSRPHVILILTSLHSKTHSWAFGRVIQVRLVLTTREHKPNEDFQHKCALGVTLTSACALCKEHRKQLDAGKRTRFPHWPTTLIGEYLILALRYTSPWSSMTNSPHFAPMKIFLRLISLHLQNANEF